MRTDKEIAGLKKRLGERIRKIDGCWEWVGTTSASGYGVLNVNGKRVMARRLSYELHIGSLGNRIVRSVCNSPGCVNPKHLILGDRLKGGRP